MKLKSQGHVLQQLGRLYRDGSPAGQTDDELLERYLAEGDHAAFETLVNKHGPMVLAVCKRVLGRSNEVDDAFQATFLVLVSKAPRIRDRTHLSCWLYGVAYRVAHRARAKQIRRFDGAIPSPQAALEAAPSDNPVVDHEIGQILDQELSRLPEKYRAPLVLCYLRSLTHDQAAGELSCPVGTVRSRLSRGRELLRKRLTRRGYSSVIPLLGTGLSDTSLILTTPVCSSLVDATVRVAIGSASLKIFPAGAATTTALALTRGVLMSMAITQWKWVGLTVALAGISVGSVVAVAYANAQPGEHAGELAPRQEPAPPPQPPVVSKDDTTKELLERIKVLEQKLAASTTVTTPEKAASEALYRAVISGRSDEISSSQRMLPSRLVAELEAELARATLERNYTARLANDRVISKNELALAETKVQSALNRLRGLNEDLCDEIARLELESKRKVAEVEKEQTKANLEAAEVARKAKLKEQATVSDFQVQEAESRLMTSKSNIAIRQIEVDEVALKIRQLRRISSRIASIVQKAGEPALQPGEAKAK
jgi:RNA polymerase sigma factor (sigma-70 family)